MNCSGGLLDKQFRKDFSRLFTSNQKKRVSKLSRIIGETAAIALIGNEKTSKIEIEVVAEIISHLNPLNIYSYKMRPNKAVLSGRTHQGNLVHIHPQFRVPKPQRITDGSRQDYWYVDMAIQLYSRRDENICIGLWGAEYDGHPQHFLESGVEKSHFRDVVMENEIGMRPIHITKEYWAKHPQEYKDNMIRYFERRNYETETLSMEDLRLSYFNVFVSPELEITGEGPIKDAISWEFVELSN